MRHNHQGIHKEYRRMHHVPGRHMMMVLLVRKILLDLPRARRVFYDITRPPSVRNGLTQPYQPARNPEAAAGSLCELHPSTHRLPFASFAPYTTKNDTSKTTTTHIHKHGLLLKKRQQQVICPRIPRGKIWRKAMPSVVVGEYDSCQH